jgi:hypothetical protein
MLVESTKHLHSGHHFVFDAGALTGFTLRALPGEAATFALAPYGSPAMFSCPARDRTLLPAPG